MTLDQFNGENTKFDDHAHRWTYDFWPMAITQ